jgi:hypothetical protein
LIAVLFAKIVIIYEIVRIVVKLARKLVKHCWRITFFSRGQG